MCFGGGGGGSSPPPVVNFTPPPAPTPPPPPEPIKKEYTPLQSPGYQPGIQSAGTTDRRRALASRGGLSRRRSLSTGISGASTNMPSGGINL